MKTQLELLYTLQTIDTNVHNAERLQRAYAREIEKLEAETRTEQERCDAARERLSLAEKAQRAREQVLRQQEERKVKTEERLQLVKTNKEYQAGLHEVESIKEAISQTEDGLLSGMDELESATAAVAAAQAELDQAQQRCQDRQSAVEQELATRLEEIEAQKSRRDEIVGQLQPDLLTTYRRLLEARDGIAVAVAEDEQCLGCSMHIPPQIYNDAVYGETVVQCPHCRRILYVQHDEMVN